MSTELEFDDLPLPSRAGYEANGNTSKTASRGRRADGLRTLTGGDDDDNDDAHEESDPGEPQVGKPHLGQPRWSSYNFTADFEDCILACLVRQPVAFDDFRKIVKPVFFNNPIKSEAVIQLFEYYQEHGKIPGFTVWANYAFHNIKRRGIVERAVEVLDYVALLAETDTSDWAGVLRMSVLFARERAIYDGIREIHAAQSEGKIDKIDPRAVIETALSVGTSITPETDADLLAAEIEDAEPVIHGVLDKGNVALFGAASKSGKTWLNLQMACGIAYTGHWLGFKCNPGKVLFINFELTRRSMQKRIAATYKALNITPDNRIHFLHMKGVAFDAASLLQSIANRCKTEGFVLVIIDPLYSLETGSSKNGDMENSNSAMAQLMFKFINLATSANVAVWTTHHFSKGIQSGKDVLDRFSGAGALGRALDTAVTMTKHKASDAMSGEKVYSVEFETRNHKEVEPFVVRWAYPLLVEDGSLDPADLAQAKKPKQDAKYDPDVLLERFTDGMTTAEHWKVVERTQGISRAEFYRLRKRLEATEKLLKKGEKWYVSEK